MDDREHIALVLLFLSALWNILSALEAMKLHALCEGWQILILWLQRSTDGPLVRAGRQLPCIHRTTMNSVVDYTINITSSVLVVIRHRWSYSRDERVEVHLRIEALTDISQTHVASASPASARPRALTIEPEISPFPQAD